MMPHPKLSTALALTMVALAAGPARADDPIGPPRGTYPTVRPEHRHAIALLDNALRYVDPANQSVDPASGYPHEGWNDEPKRGLHLRAFTQLTAIGLYMELLAGVVAGEADTPALSRDAAIAGLTKLVESLRRDQRDPRLSSKGLLVNFLDLASGRRLSPLASDVEKSMFVEVFGPDLTPPLWDALREKGWIAPRSDGKEAEVRRDKEYGWDHFKGPLAPYADEDTKRKTLGLLDRRVVLVVFGDNANLSAAVARTAGALLHPAIADRPEVVAIRNELEGFLDDQKVGYSFLFEPEIGLFDFGYDATKARLFGWEDAKGNWTAGHMDYLVNEFRGPAAFVAARHEIPGRVFGNLGFQIRPYKTRSGSTLFALAPWEGSAFQGLGLSLAAVERESPSWRELLGNLVAIEIDNAAKRGLPGFLSESYTGDGVEYTGRVGIPEITVAPKPRIIDAASLYTLGVAYNVDPEAIEGFLAANWGTISALFTDHGPWEGYNTTQKAPITLQTSAHTLSLALGLLGTGPDHMRRYLDARPPLSSRLAAMVRPAEAPTDLLGPDVKVFAWADREGHVEGVKTGPSFRLRGEAATRFGVAFVSDRPHGIDASGTRLTLRYRAPSALPDAILALKPATPNEAAASVAASLIPKEIRLSLEATPADGPDSEVVVPLPAMIGLATIKEFVLTRESPDGPHPVDLTLTGFTLTPIPAKP